MKKILISIIFFSSIVFSSEYIKNMEVNVKVDENAIIHVNEKIVYETDEEGKRGIFRVIPFIYSKGSYLKLEDRIAIKDFKVENFDYVRVYENYENLVSYRIGNPEIYLEPNKEYTYNISYDMYNVLRQKEGISQIYLNIIGNYIDMPIENASVRIENLDGEVEIYTGANGETNKDYIIKGNTIIATKVLGNREGMSILINNNNFDYSMKAKIINKYNAYPMLFSSIVILFCLIIINILTIIRKIKEKIRKNIAYVVTFNPPKESALLSKMILNTKTEYSDIMIEIAEKISRDEIVYDKEKEKYYDQRGIDVFSSKYSSYNKELKIVRSTKNEYKKYYIEQILIYFFITILFIPVIFYTITKNYNQDFLPIFPMIIIYILTFFNVITVYRAKDRYFENYSKIKGFEMFLTKVETDKFSKFIAAKDILEYFKKILPYALAFGLDNEYMILLNKALENNKELKDLYFSTPAYYFMQNRYIYNGFTKDNIRATMPKSSSNSFGSDSNFSGGFSSGGSSGGGFGGGGVSSW